MDNPSRAPAGCALPVAGVLALIAACAAMPYIYFIRDYDYIQGTARRVQDAGALAAEALSYGLIGLLAILGLAGLVIVTGLFTRWASPLARQAATEIAIARAQHMELPDALSTYNVTNHYRGPREALPVELREPASQVIEGEVAAPAPALPPPAETFAYGVSRVKQLVDRGHAAPRSGQIFVGYAGQAPRHIRADEWGMAAIIGKQHTGKSSLAQGVIAQAVLDGWVVLACDPLGNREKRSLIRHYLPGLSGGLYRQAVREEEIAATIGLFMKVAGRRLDHGETGEHVLLVIDEFATVASRKMITEEQMAAFFLVATKGAGAKLHTLLIAHDLKGDWFGGRSARQGRDQLSHKLICNMTPDAVGSVLPGGEYARQVATLPIGQALFFDGWEAPSLISFPQLSPDDLAWAAGDQPPRPYAPWEPRLPAPAPPLAPPPPTAAQLAPTVPLPPPAPPRAAPPTATLDWSTKERILDALASHSAGLDAASLARQLGEAQSTVKTRLAELKAEGVVDARRAPQGRHFLYSLVRRPPAA